MRWFEGTIPDAINSAKQRSFAFVVVITGEDEQSAQLMSSWEDDQVSEAALNCCVAIRVDAKSDTCLQFCQFYPVVCVPSSFFIGENGIPLEVIPGSVSAEELMKRINRVKQMHAQQIGGVTVSPEAGPPVETSPHNSTATEPAPASAPAVSVRSAAEVTKSRGCCCCCSRVLILRIDKNAQCVCLLFPLIQNDIKKEMERRKIGKDMQDFKKKQEDEKTKRLLEERNREKAEEKAARERVKQQIAMDRADRAVRYAKTQEEEKAAREALLQARQAEQEARREAVVRERSTVARIQFRLPDGSSFTNQFPAQSRLQEARLFAVQEVGNRYGNFSLATMFPRREFNSEDMNKTLQELELAPSASIVLLPRSGRSANTVVQSSGGGIWAILGSLLYPLLAVWRFLSSFIFPAPPPPGAASPGPTQQSSSSYTTSSSSSSSSSASDKTKRETLSKTTVEKRPKHFKKEGKICRLRTQEDSEDDNNTWNGNSTQQM
uniref:UBX domain-containing protein 4 n=1 Tax=Seriola lalandi dorsalis TaxID=1841481 RepID=A0A3B4WLS3_SERLL